MGTLTERLDPAIRRQLLKDDVAFIGQPFVLGAGTARPIQAHTRHMALMLLDGAVKDRASRVAAYAENLIDITSRKYVTERVDCAKGCSHCCTVYVSTTLPEVFRLADAVRGHAEIMARINAAAAAYTAGADRVACPILDNHACAAYLNRPSVCRSVMSTSVETCRRITFEGSSEPFATPQNLGEVRVFTITMLRAALALAGLPNSNYGLSQALHVALTNDDAEARWLAGEPLFADTLLGRGDRARTKIDGLVDALVGAMRPTI